MTQSCKTRLCTFALALLLSVSLTACLPGKEQEKKVIAEAKEATATVQAEKAAADLSNAAQKLLATMHDSAPLITSSNELHTIACNNKVIAYVPKTSRLAKNGELPQSLAQRMRTELQRSSGTDAVVDANASAVSGCNITSIVADNSPILVLNDTAAAMLGNSTDTTGFVAINMMPCSGNRPGVMIHKTKADNSVVVEDRCSATAAPTNLSTITVASSKTMPNYSERMRPGGNIAAVENFKCIAGNSGCNPVSEVYPGEKISCQTISDDTDLVANAKYNNASRTWQPDGGSVACGHDWSGELVARIKTQKCQVIRNGQAEEIPAKVYDVAYVGAKCTKNATTWSACPAGAMFEETGHMLHTEPLRMMSTLALSPYKDAAQAGANKNRSSIGYKRTVTTTTQQGYTLGYIDTNIGDPEVDTLLSQSSVQIKVPGGERAENFFHAVSNLSASPTNEFDQNYVTEMKALNKMTLNGTPTCYALAQDCYIREKPSNVEIVVDRSMPMTLPNPVATLDSYTVCRATLANMFNADKRGAACEAVNQWKGKAANAISSVKNSWNYSEMTLVPSTKWPFIPRQEPNDPVVQGNTLLDAWKKANPQDAAQLKDIEDELLPALTSPKLKDRLMYALAVGQDCNPGTVNGTLLVQENMFGSCMPNVVTTSTAGSYAGGQELKSCQTSCPGECVTGLNGPIGLPKRVDVADEMLVTGLLPRIPVNTKINYSEIILETVTGATQLKGAPTGASAAGVNTEHVVAVLKGQLKTVAQNRPAAQGMESPIFESIDKAIDRLRRDVLDADRNAHATIVVFGSKWDTNCVKNKQSGWAGKATGLLLLADPMMFAVGHAIDQKNNGNCTDLYESRYFARNICEPQRIPTGYQCEYCAGVMTNNPLNGQWSCIGKKERKDINMSELEDKGLDGTLAGKLSDGSPMDTLAARANWCKAHEYKKCEGPSIKGNCLVPEVKYNAFGGPHPVFGGTRVPGWDRPTTDNHDSLVGFLGRNYPNVKIYYMDFDGDSNGKSLGSMCKNDFAYDPDKPNGYFIKNSIPKLVYNGYNVKANIDDLMVAIEASTGNGKPDPEAGAKICRDKYGNNVAINYQEPPVPFTSNLSSFDSQVTGNCDGPLLYNTSSQSSTPAATPMIPEGSRTANPGCINGYKPYTLKTPC